MKLTHDFGWDAHHEGDETLKGIEDIVQRAFEHVGTITRKTTIKILTGIHYSKEEPTPHVLVEIDRGCGCLEETYVYVVREGLHHVWDRNPPIPVKTAHVPSALMRVLG
jgi:hypothetical protein